MSDAAKPPGLFFGGDYNPEQWPEDVWIEDARLMREAGVNLVSVGIFAWAALEPRPGAHDWGWLDRALDLLHAHEVGVNLASPTASPPPWFSHAHPHSLPVTADGVRLSHGSRQHFCPNSPAYRTAALDITRRVAERYGSHPAVRSWHVGNEYGCHVRECHCEHCQTAFREWLRAKYGSVDALNAAWGGAFWGQRYADWDEVRTPRRVPATIGPGHDLDYRRFFSDSLLACVRAEARVLRDLTAQPITTNFLGFLKPTDYWAWAPHLDVIANDCYPDPSKADAMIESAAASDLMRSLGGGRPWMLMEQVTSHTNWMGQNPVKAPGQMRLMSLQAVARGADAVMFFQWRQSLRGFEQFHGAMLPHGGPDTRVFSEVRALGAELERLADVSGTRVEARVALVFDWDSWWALEHPGKPAQDLTYEAAWRPFYDALWRQNVTVDFVRPDADWSRYALCVMPCGYVLTPGALANLEAFVRGGGTLLSGPFSGVVGEHAELVGASFAQGLSDVSGVTLEEFVPLAPGETLLSDLGEVRLLVERVHARDAEVLARVREGWLAGAPLLTERRVGRGRALHLAGVVDPAAVLARLCDELGLRAPIEAPPSVEVVRRGDALFLLNHSPEPVTVRGVALDGYGVAVVPFEG